MTSEALQNENLEGLDLAAISPSQPVYEAKCINLPYYNTYWQWPESHDCSSIEDLIIISNFSIQGMQTGILMIMLGNIADGYERRARKIPEKRVSAQ